jgi:hypothetical protein
MTTLPNRDVLREEFNAAVQELLDKKLTNPMLTTPWYSQIGDSLFNACYRALEDACQENRTKGFPGTPYSTSGTPLHVVSAPVGSGKTSFSIAFIAAVVRAAERDEDTPYGCLFVVDQITRAEGVYRDLNALLPGKVAVWSSEHDPGCKERTKVPDPAGTYTKDQLKDYPVAVVTHAFFSGKGSYKARQVLNRGHMQPRALTVVDERIEEVTVYDVELSAAHQVRELLQQDEQAAAHVGPHMDALVDFMHLRDQAGGGTLEKPTTDIESWRKAEHSLRWFNTPAAIAFAKKYGGNSNVAAVFGFAKSVAIGYAFINRQQGTHFVGYENKLDIAPGTVLLDATSDIDGVSQICPYREHQGVPKARYDNLLIVHVPAHTKKRLSQYLKGYKNRKAYVDWMLQTITAHVEPGQKALVVCRKSLFDNRCVPNWAEKDGRHDTPELFTKHYGWNIGGRKLSAIHWGTGIGENHWKDADVVLLFDEFWLPRRTVIATTQGLRRHKATEGDLGNMGAANSKAPAVDTIQDGHLLRWTKQMALRGRGRSYDEQGVCGHQKLVCSGDFKRLLVHADKLFPGAEIQYVVKDDCQQTQAEAFLALLSRPNLSRKLTQRWIGEQLKTPWRAVSKHIMQREDVQRALRSRGWEYVPHKGRGGSYFQRSMGDQEALLAA